MKKIINIDKYTDHISYDQARNLHMLVKIIIDCFISTNDSEELKKALSKLYEKDKLLEIFIKEDKDFLTLDYKLLRKFFVILVYTHYQILKDLYKNPYISSIINAQINMYNAGVLKILNNEFERKALNEVFQIK